MWTAFLVVAGLLGLVAGAALTALYFERRRLAEALAEVRRLRAKVRVLESQVRVQKAEIFDVEARIAELWARGWSIRQIAKEVGLSKTTVWRRIQRLRGEAPPVRQVPRKEPLPLEAS